MTSPTVDMPVFPSGLSPRAERLLLHGDDTGPARWGVGDPPIPGDLWTATSDAHQQGPIGLLLLARVDDAAGTIDAMPATPVDDRATAPAMLLADSPLSVPLHVWPALTMPVDYRVLHRRLGQTIEAITLAAVMSRPWERVAATRRSLPYVGPWTAEPTIEQALFVRELRCRMRRAFFSHAAPHFDQEAAA